LTIVVVLATVFQCASATTSSWRCKICCSKTNSWWNRKGWHYWERWIYDNL